jgi:hypothetical protein
MDTSTPSWLKEVLRRQELMDDVMQKSGVDVLTAIRADNGQAFFEARTKCRVCPHERDCEIGGWSRVRRCGCLQISAPMPISSARASVQIIL